jgi:hypothetical protein
VQRARIHLRNGSIFIDAKGALISLRREALCHIPG